jgi:hypothetical protein
VIAFLQRQRVMHLRELQALDLERLTLERSLAELDERIALLVGGRGQAEARGPQTAQAQARRADAADGQRRHIRLDP